MNLDSVLRQPAWMKQARCTSSDPEYWWYEQIDMTKERVRFKEQVVKASIAVEYCNECPVRKECLEMGLKKENMVAGGIWGGLIFSERLMLTGHKHNKTIGRERHFRNHLRKKIAKIPE